MTATYLHRHADGEKVVPASIFRSREFPCNIYSNLIHRERSMHHRFCNLQGDSKENLVIDRRDIFLERNLPATGIVTGFICVSFLSAASFFSISNFQDHTDWVNHTHRVQLDLEQVMFLASDAVAATRGFAISGDPGDLSIYENIRREIPAKSAELVALIADNTQQRDDISLVNSELEHIITLQEKIVASRRGSGSAAPALAMIAEGRGKAALDEMRALVTEMQQRETTLLTERESKVVAIAHETKYLIIFGTIVTYLVFSGAFWLLEREMRQRKHADQGLLAANSKLLQHAEQLELANKELESFSYSVSHDLRVPLRAISGYASMLAEDYEDKLDSEGHRLLNVIRESSKRMGALIDDLLAFSKFGKQTLTHTEIDMRAMAEQVIAELRDLDNRPNISVVVEELPTAWGDYALLRQVWRNLISNALKYSGKKAMAEILVSGKNGGNETTYTVHDNGAGFDMQYYNKLFGVFQRLHTAVEFVGIGVGLAIVQRIVQRHSGRVWAEGAVNQGATFFFSLPNKE
jgi:signal transduction histidine kinase